MNVEVIRKTQIQPPIDKVIIKLNRDEAVLLRQLLGNIGGGPIGGYHIESHGIGNGLRSMTDHLYCMLCESGVPER